MHAVDIKTGSGLNFTVLPDRCMDIAWADFKGMAIGFMSNTGVVSPVFYQEEENEGFFKKIFGGLLTTCGLTYMGAPNIDQGQKLGLHGVISNTPAEDVCMINEWENDEFVMQLRGKVRQSQLYGENMVLTREITTKLGAKNLRIIDTIENLGYTKQPLMLLYHVNFGYPLVGKDTILLTPQTKVKARNSDAQKGLETYHLFQEQTPHYAERVFYHELTGNEQGETYACLWNETLSEQGLGAYVRYNNNELPYLAQWKQMGEGEYVVGLEPCTDYAEGRSTAREKGILNYIAPGEVKKFELEIGIVENKQELESLI